MGALTIKPHLFESYHCALLSVEQDQGLANFSPPDVLQFLDIPRDTLGEMCSLLTSYWGGIRRIDGIEIRCGYSSHIRTLYLIFDGDIARLENRVTKLGYLLNQRTVLILPKGEKVRRYTLHKQGNIFSPSYKTKEYTDIDDIIHYYFRFVYQENIPERKTYHENWRFCNANAMTKGFMHLCGERVDKKLAKIEINQAFDIEKALNQESEK